LAAGSFAFSVGAGTNQHTITWTRGAVTGHAGLVHPAEYQEASYRIDGQGSSVATTNDDTLQVMAGSTLNVYVRGIRIWQAGLSAAANTVALDLMRVTTAGTGGTVITPRKLNSGDAAAGCTAMSAVPNATRGTAGDLLGRYRLALSSAQPTNSNGAYVVYEAQTILESIRIAAGTTNGLVLRVSAGITTAPSIDWELDVTELNY
jgi:hypothetical protein